MYTHKSSCDRATQGFNSSSCCIIGTLNQEYLQSSFRVPVFYCTTQQHTVVTMKLLCSYSRLGHAGKGRPHSHPVPAVVLSFEKIYLHYFDFILKMVMIPGIDTCFIRILYTVIFSYMNQVSLTSHTFFKHTISIIVFDLHFHHVLFLLAHFENECGMEILNSFRLLYNS